jgi:alpha-beta hydrolase superfamily lysophospholipase
MNREVLPVQFRESLPAPTKVNRDDANNSENRRGNDMRLNGLALILVSGLALAGCGKSERPKTDLAASQVTTIGVNSYLWRASLDALSFMPLVQTDSAGGVIVTDWYVNPQTPGERMKLTVSILDKDLRADALRVAASREVAQGGQWVAAPTKAATVQKLEGIILTKARDLRRSAIAE